MVKVAPGARGSQLLWPNSRRVSSRGQGHISSGGTLGLLSNQVGWYWAKRGNCLWSCGWNSVQSGLEPTLGPPSKN